MKEDFFKVWYTMYIEKDKPKVKNWTSKITKKILKYKILFITISIITMCLAMNFFLIYKFIEIIETNFVY